MFGLGLGLGIHRHSNANPYAFPFISRVESDGGIIRDKAALLNLTYYLQSMMPNTKLLYCPELGVKLRTSGINNYVTKLYDLGPGMMDATQTTALNQPFLSGNIAPNEKYCLKYLESQSINTALGYSSITFNSAESWSMSAMIRLNKRGPNLLYLGPTSYIAFDANKISFSGGSGNIQISTQTYAAPIGKYFYIEIGSSGTNVYIRVNGVSIPIVLYVNGSVTFQSINHSNTSFGGSIQYFYINNKYVSQNESNETYAYLRSLFPEMESVQIGTQTWATSNCEMTCTPQGNVIQEMQNAANIEKITNVADREFTSDTGWNIMGGWSISDGTANCNASSWSILSKSYASTPFVSGKLYRVSFTVTSRTSGTDLRVVLGNNAVVDVGTLVGEKIAYLKFVGPDVSVLQIGSVDFVGSIDNISFQEVGWADSTNLYNYMYAKTTGTAEQKEYAAVKAAAMWCYYNNDPALGAVYGKLYNWYAVRLLQMDIDYYNAANPTATWGWRVPSATDWNILRTYLGGYDIAGGKTKKDGLEYWGPINTGADNSTGLSIIGSGRKESGVGFATLLTAAKFWIPEINTGVTFSNSTTSIYLVAADPIERGYSLRLIKA